MRRSIAAAALAALLPVAPVLAFMTGAGSGSGVAGLGDLDPPTAVVASASGASVVISWGAATAPGGAPVDGYHVQRSSGATSAAACGTSPSVLTTNTSCTDASVPAGSHVYVVTAVYRTWTAASSGATATVLATDPVPPALTAISRVTASPTNVSAVSWSVTFSEAVSGFSAADLRLVAEGVGGTPELGAITGGPSAYTVSATTGTSGGTLRLDLVDDDSIVDAAGNPLGGVGGATHTGPTYTIDRVRPGAHAIGTDRSGGRVEGRMDPGDRLLYTFTEPMASSSVIGGWDGTSIAVTVEVDGGSGCTPNTTSCLRIEGANLGTIDLGSGAYAANHGARYTLPATAVMTTVSGRSVVTVTFGGTAPAGGTVTGPTTLTWAPSGSRDLAGNEILATTVAQPVATGNF